MKTLYLTRHGETMFNAQHRIQGWCDSPLTAHGREQARALGAILRERGVQLSGAVCSTAERASDTLELMLDELGHAGLPYQRCKDLREMFYGDLEAQQDFLAENDPEACRTYYLQFGGESSDTVRDRMLGALTRIMLSEPGDTVLAVGHGGANFNFLRAIQDPMPVLKAGWGNCTTCVYAFDEHKVEGLDAEVELGKQPSAATSAGDPAATARFAEAWQLVDVLRL